MELKATRVERDGAVATVWLHRPHRHNAWTGRMHAEYRWIMAELDTHVSAWDAAVVAVNHLEYGGSGNGSNGIAVYSVAPSATQIAIHELGHVLGLADEYDDLIDRWPGAEPDEPNATADTSAAKWGTFVTATNLPTWSSTDCSVSNEGVADPEPGA